ncbi:hypothetical protein TNCV_183191 [Trichonephila clavipes]|nr:hypothetical protein TNCV_183191 [Trichonephila clavipes]
MATLGDQSFPPTNLGRVDEEMVPPGQGGYHNTQRSKLITAGVVETSTNITARVIERDVCGPLHRFLEESRGFRTRQ